MEVRRVIHRRIRHESPGISVVADVNAVVAANVGTGTQAKTAKHREGSMKESEERRVTNAPPTERVDEAGGKDTSGRAAPIDEDVAGELNAALPENEPEGGTKDEPGGPARAA